MGDAPGELLQLLRLALRQRVTVLLDALHVPHRPDRDPGREQRDHRAEGVELPGEAVSLVPRRLDALRGLLGSLDVV